MKDDIKDKIHSLLKKGAAISEAETRSLMILLRKRRELMTDDEKNRFHVLNLFCNWCAHTKIDRSIAGLRILAIVNDTLVEIKDSSDDYEVQAKISESIGYVSLRREISAFLSHIGLDNSYISDNDIWGHILIHLVEIIKDVPLMFPPVSKLNHSERRIYDSIVSNPVAPGAGVTMMIVSKVDYSTLGIPGAGELFAAHIRLENTTTIVIPMLLNVTLR